MADSYPVLEIDLNSPVPLHRQIASSLRALLVSNTIAAGDLLPTVRRLALDLGINHNTVAEAYRILAKEGWISLKRRRGALVLSRPAPAHTPEAEAQFNQMLLELLADARSNGVSVERILKGIGSAAERIRKEEANRRR